MTPIDFDYCRVEKTSTCLSMLTNVTFYYKHHPILILEINFWVDLYQVQLEICSFLWGKTPLLDLGKVYIKLL
jgi:hypothetical protein